MLTDNPDDTFVLVVEDDSSHAELIRRNFEGAQESYRLEIARSLKEAQAIMEHRTPGIVLTDYRLPDGNGSELVMMAAGAWPVIMMTSFGSEQVAVEAMKIGVLDYIVKSPQTFATLPYIVSFALKSWSLVLARRLAEQSLRESEEKYKKLANEQQIILNCSSVGISLLKGRKVIWANPAFDRIFGYETGATRDMGTWEFYADKASYVHIGSAAYTALTAGKVFSQDLMMKMKDGTRIWCNLTGQSVSFRNIEDGSIWSILDITERKRAEEERQKLEQQFQQAQKLECLGVLAGGIAHDFNNILTIIMGHCYMVKEELDGGMTEKAHVLEIEIAAGRAAELCRQMLAYAGKGPQFKELISLSLLVDEIVKMLQSAIKKNVVIQLDVNHEVPEISGDSSQLQQIVMNLIINASEAIADNNGTIRVSFDESIISAEQPADDFMGMPIPPGRYACLVVSDDGCGMDDEVRMRIFEPFYTTKFTGRGLGMSAILGIIKTHDGALQLSSSPGVGTTFRVYLPLAHRRGDSKEEHAADSLPAMMGIGTVLLVDDEDSLLTIGAVLLKAIGYLPITASNGRDALHIYRERGNEIDLILLDLIMPGMGGVETYHEIRKIDPDIPIIICSGYSAEDVSELIDRDCQFGFVQKPYRLDHLRHALQKMLGEAEAAL